MSVSSIQPNQHRSNNFDFLRLVAAFFVIWGHSFSLSGKTPPSFWATAVSTLGVYIFFALSGYLVTESWLRDRRALVFFAKRALRIFPALAVCVTITAVVIGPTMTRLTLADYFSHPYFVAYFQNIALYIKYFLPAVFEKNTLPNAVNGSLWSLPAEFVCYILLAFIGAISARLFDWLIVLVGLSVAVSSYYLTYGYHGPQIVWYGTDVKAAASVIPFFFMGSLLRVWGGRIALRLDIALVLCVVLSVLERTTHGAIFTLSLWLFLPYIVLSLGTASTPVLSKSGRYGDFSYGMYLYSFPLQQVLVHYWGAKLGGAGLTVISALISVGAAYASWHLVEKNALRLKPGRKFAGSQVERSSPLPRAA